MNVQPDKENVMKTIPLAGLEQKQTKLTKTSWRAELCDAMRVHNRSVADSPAFTMLRRGKQELALPFARLFASFVIFCLIGAGLSLVCASSSAQTPDNVAEREVHRRQAGITQGEAAMARGQAAMKAKDFAAARIAEGRYADAEAILSEILSDRYDPKCRPAQELYAHLRQPGYFNKTMSPTFIEKVEQVKQLLTEADGFYQSGRYDLAMKRYEQVLALDPYNTAARRGQEKINNTKYKYGEEAYNETRSRQLWQVEKGWEQPVRRYGGTGEPARLGIQKNLTDTARINNKLNTIIIPRVEFRDATRREAVNFLREQAVENDPATEGERGINIVLPPSVGVQRPPPPPAGASPAPAGATAPGTAPAGTPPVCAGQSVAPPPAPPAERGSITIELNHIPLGEALRYIANQAGLKVKVESYAVSLVPRTEQSGDLLVKRYRVPPEFFGGPLDVGYYIESGGAGGQTGAGGLAQPAPVAENIIQKEAVSYQTASGTGTGAGASSQSNLVQGTSTTRQHLSNDRQLVGRADAKTMLQSMGVQFPTITLPDGRADAASATFWPHTGVLIVRNTQDNFAT